MLNLKWTFCAQKSMISQQGLLLHPDVNLLTFVDLLAEFLKIKRCALKFTLLKALWRQILVKLLHDHPDDSADRLRPILNLRLKQHGYQQRIGKFG